ncbi:tetraspanin-8 [Astyanax mexicanus]|uniref:Tetraspanin n=1 Tax=Astyanax mexicanus TaxID=7994 RepID=A0A8B9HBA7_ASTMX|nr:tetraspanin-8 [Astyanax mexicanus]KAG9280538.1 tetraspanin-8-like [Astyanax mexicanus]
MSKINLCFKRIFVFFNVLFAILGALILSLGLLAHVQLHEAGGNKLTGVIVLVVVGFVIFILSVLGAYGAQKENRNVLIAFFVIMCMGTISLFRMAVQIAISREQVISEFQKLGHLDQADSDIKNTMELLQLNAKCCGLFNGYKDWGNEVPTSCNCEDTKHDRCQVYSSDENQGVFSQPCGPIILGYLNTALNITLGAFIGFGVLSLLAAVMSLVMIIRITAPTVSPPAIFDLNYKPPKYSELVPSA